MAKAKVWGAPDREQMDRGNIGIYCPGCKTHHVLNIKEHKRGPGWGFNQNFERPTFTPSLLVKTGLHAGAQLAPLNDPEYPKAEEWNKFLKETSTICHSFITDGRIQFLGDSTHELAGKTVDLPEIE